MNGDSKGGCVALLLVTLLGFLLALAAWMVVR